ncbi:hypothetical protein HU230_0036770 [Bradyrhizobium quebecense]|uniref:Uncharacterized protein n=1 Tax=Bradyrhizobium quebecense TaxID=2748629 RepID=A0A973WTS3_9BRAD|nr:hypothetical protein [Bradyrhizobium quebecense]UGA43743.1 hypothetical protein HU230_0036770 [Bradyrhizobium quebecense]
MNWTPHDGVIVQWKRHKTKRRYWGFIGRADGELIWFGEGALDSNAIDRHTFGKGDHVKFALFPECRDGNRPTACKVWLVKRAQENGERDVA